MKLKPAVENGMYLIPTFQDYNYTRRSQVDKIPRSLTHTFDTKETPIWPMRWKGRVKKLSVEVEKTRYLGKRGRENHGEWGPMPDTHRTWPGRARENHQGLPFFRALHWLQAKIQIEGCFVTRRGYTPKGQGMVVRAFTKFSEDKSQLGPGIGPVGPFWSSWCILATDK